MSDKMIVSKEQFSFFVKNANSEKRGVLLTERGAVSQSNDITLVVPYPNSDDWSNEQIAAVFGVEDVLDKENTFFLPKNFVDKARKIFFNPRHDELCCLHHAVLSYGDESYSLSVNTADMMNQERRHVEAQILINNNPLEDWEDDLIPTSDCYHECTLDVTSLNVLAATLSKSGAEKIKCLFYDDKILFMDPENGHLGALFVEESEPKPARKDPNQPEMFE